MEDSMKTGILLSTVALSLSLSQAIACDIHGKTGFMPENNLSIAVGDKMANTMTEEKFNAIIGRV